MKILNIIKTKTFSQSLITTTATAASGILGILFYILLARLLKPAEFGIFSVGIATLTLLADVANVGTDTGIVRFVGKYFSQDLKKALRFLKLGLEIKLIVGVILAIVGWVIAPWVATIVLQKPELSYPLQIASIGCLGAMLYSFATSSIQATQKFIVWGVLTVSANALRLILILLFAITSLLTLQTSLWVYAAIPFLGFIIALFVLPPFFKVTGEKKIAGEFFHYNKWVALFTLVAAIAAKTDIYLSTRLLTLSDVGIYGVAVGLASIVPQIVFAIATVVAPKLAGYQSNQEVKKYLLKLQMLVSALAFAGFIVGALLSVVLIPLLYGAEYWGSIPVFIILLLSQAIFLISLPAHTSVFYYFSFPKLFVFITLGHMAIVVTAGIALIQAFGVTGAALAMLIGSIFNFVVPAIWVIHKLKK